VINLSSIPKLTTGVKIIALMVGLVTALSVGLWKQIKANGALDAVNTQLTQSLAQERKVVELLQAAHERDNQAIKGRDDEIKKLRGKLRGQIIYVKQVLKSPEVKSWAETPVPPAARAALADAIDSLQQHTGDTNQDR